MATESFESEFADRVPSETPYARSQWEEAPVGLAATDQDGALLRVNSRMGEMTGLSPEALAGAPLEAFLSSSGEPLQDMPVKAAPTRRLSLRTSSGREIPVAVRSVPVRSGDQEQFLWALMEIPEAGIGECRTELLREREEHGRAASFRSRFLTNVSREMRTPLSSILGMVRLLLDSEPTQAQRDILEDMETAASSLRFVMDNLLDYTDTESGNDVHAASDFDVRQVLEAVLEAFSRAASRKGLVLSLEVAQDVPSNVRTDQARLRQVAACLLDNAVKFTSAGKVAVRARMETPGLLVLEVEDTGIGLDEYGMSALRDAPARAALLGRWRHPGAGLGLAVCKRLLEAMGGAISARNAIGGGAVFTCIIPVGLSEQDADGPAHEASEAHQFQTGGGSKASLRILLAEDNAVNRRFTTKFLIQRGHRVTAAENGRAALDALARDVFDIVLMDISMPEMDGMEATLAIRGHDGSRFDPRIPIVAVTAHAMRGDEERFLEAGMDAYLSKPLDLEHFERVILEVCSVSVACPAEAEKAPAKQAETAAPAPRGGEPFDTAQQARRFANMGDILPELLALFVKNCGSTLDSLRAAMEGGNHSEAVRAAHTLKGMAAVVCATGVEAAAQALEKALSNQPGENHGHLCERLELQVALAMNHLRAPIGGPR
ncbi:response regulator [Fundidesulfovibrio agrisoli]|uniref:response regulator n=1 Tax=Fundidesulfovibrio agrisoli TaxID=2922717 RepID=UPI001FAB8FBC|nr:response regulator [Fundidesulfovibrio agrisoli]